MQGTAWQDETLVKALKLRLSCGSQGYSVVRELASPLPTERTIQRRIEGFKFTPGILTEMFDILKIKISVLSEQERHAVLMLDEIQLTKGMDFDPSTGRIMGTPTVPPTKGSTRDNALATHGLVFMLGGLSTRWKQTVAYELTESSFHAATIKARIVDIIDACEQIGIKVHAVISDMGPCNRAVWRCFHLPSGKHVQKKPYILHPQDSARHLYFLADVPHLLKNLRSHLTRRQKIYLPDVVVKANNLPTNEVSIQYIEELIELEHHAEFKVAPRLKKACLSPGHFDKMKVGPAYTLFHHDTAAALQYHIEKGNLDKEAQTTAWFVQKVHEWFAMMTSRTKKEALMHKGEKGRRCLEGFMGLVRDLSIGDKGGAWKPIQTGILLSTGAALAIQEELLGNHGFSFVLFSRLSQDALENFFSTIRLRNPVPKPRDFKSALRSASLAQFLRPNANGSYAASESEMFVGIRDKKEHQKPVSVICPTQPMLACFSPDDVEAFEYLCGYVVYKVNKNFKSCNICTAAILQDKPLKE